MYGICAPDGAEKQESYMKDCCVSVPIPEGFYTELNEGEGFHYVQYSRLGSAFMMLRFYPVELLIIALSLLILRYGRRG